MKNLIIITAITFALRGSSQAAVLTFDGNICSENAEGGGAFVACDDIDNNRINQGYGDTLFANVSYGRGSGGSINFASPGVVIAEDDSDGIISIMPLGEATGIRLNSFSVVPYLGLNVEMVIQVRSGAGTLLWTTGPDEPLAIGPNAVTLTPNISSADGIQIRFFYSSFDAGLDNINFTEILPEAGIPEPSTFGMFGIAGTGLLLALRRRQS